MMENENTWVCKLGMIDMLTGKCSMTSTSLLVGSSEEVTEENTVNSTWEELVGPQMSSSSSMSWGTSAETTMN